MGGARRGATLAGAMVLAVGLVVSLAPAAAVAATTPMVSVDARFACVLQAAGTIKCFGYNQNGQLGNGVTNVSTQSTPVSVVGITNAVGIDAGQLHACAVLATGTVKCWGAYGGVVGGTGTPVTVPGLARSIAVSAGTNHTCALTTGKTVRCWSRGFNGQVGSVGAPTRTVGLSANIAAISVGTRHSCAVTDLGTAKCWGANDSGQLGDGTKTDRDAAVTVRGIPKVARIAAGANHTCAVTVAGRVYCWGDNASRQLAAPAPLAESLTPRLIGGLSTVVDVAAGYYSTCAVHSGGAAKCWGATAAGLATFVSPAPVTVPLGGVARAAVGNAHSCAVLGTGVAKCWGVNTYGQLGNGGTTRSLTPVSPIGL